MEIQKERQSYDMKIQSSNPNKNSCCKVVDRRLENFFDFVQNLVWDKSIQKVVIITPRRWGKTWVVQHLKIPTNVIVLDDPRVDECEGYDDQKVVIVCTATRELGVKLVRLNYQFRKWPMLYQYDCDQMGWDIKHLNLKALNEFSYAVEEIRLGSEN